MASLSSGLNLGSASASSLLRSAASIQNTVQSIQDKAAADAYSSSAYTDGAYQTYSSYLQGRINQLNSTGTPANVLKAMSVSDNLRAATRQNISSTIARENIQVLAGNASKTDKYNIIVGQYQRAASAGDMTQAQQLESQAYSLSQSIQYDAQQAAASARTLQGAAASSGARSWNQVGQTLEDKLKQFNNDVTHAGQKSYDTLITKFVNDNQATFNQLGIHLTPGSKPNIFDTIDGVNRAIFKAYAMAGDAVAATAADGGQSYYNKAKASAYNIQTPYGTMNAQQLATAAANPNNFSYNQAPDYVGQNQKGPMGQQNPQVGYKFNATLDKTGNFAGVQPVVAQTPWIDIPKNITNQLNTLGLTVVGGAKEGGEGYTIRPSAQTPSWLKKALPSNSTTVALSTPQGLQFEADSVSGQGKAVYTITKDATGKHGVYESSNLGDKLIGGDNGYDAYPDLTKQKSQGWLGRILGGVNNAASPIFSLFGGQASAQELISNSQIAQQNAAAAKAMLAYTPPPLPNISIAPPPPTPSISQAHGPTPATPTYPVAPRTVNPQQPTVNPQAPGGFNLQGGGFRLQ